MCPIVALLDLKILQDAVGKWRIEVIRNTTCFSGKAVGTRGGSGLCDRPWLSDCTTLPHNQQPFASLHAIDQSDWILYQILQADVGHQLTLARFAQDLHRCMIAAIAGLIDGLGLAPEADAA